MTLKRGLRLIFIHFSSLDPTMLMFNLAISCLTTSNLPWFMDLTFQVPMQYCSLEHQILLSQPDTSTAKHHFHFGPATSFFLELLVIALSSSPGAYWTPSDLGRGGGGWWQRSSSGVISFCMNMNTGVGCHFLLQWTSFFVRILYHYLSVLDSTT